MERAILIDLSKHSDPAVAAAAAAELVKLDAAEALSAAETQRTQERAAKRAALDSSARKTRKRDGITGPEAVAAEVEAQGADPESASFRIRNGALPNHGGWPMFHNGKRWCTTDPDHESNTFARAAYDDGRVQLHPDNGR